ncbi:MAG: hypothetical protein RIR18_421 [Pseudomonadota bacterium]|jgi:hypothetical protein
MRTHSISNEQRLKNLEREAAALRRELEKQTGTKKQSQYLPKKLKPKGGKQQRNCMCCQKEFMSDGAWNRLCSPCRHKGTTPFDI